MFFPWNEKVRSPFAASPEYLCPENTVCRSAFMFFASPESRFGFPFTAPEGQTAVLHPGPGPLPRLFENLLPAQEKKAIEQPFGLGIFQGEPDRNLPICRARRKHTGRTGDAFPILRALRTPFQRVRGALLSFRMPENRMGRPSREYARERN